MSAPTRQADLEDLQIVTWECRFQKLMQKFVNQLSVLRQKKLGLTVYTVNCEIAELDAAIVRPGRLRTARDFRLLTHSEAIELAQHRGLPVPLQRREYSLAEIYNPDEPNVREMLATPLGFFVEN